MAPTDLDGFYTYESCGPLGAISHYQGTGTVTPVVDGTRAFMEWFVQFDCPAEEQENCTNLLEEAMPQSFMSLRAVLEK